MFGQFRPWLDCDRGCSFCYIDKKTSAMSIDDKRRSLMRLSTFLSDEAKKCDRIGLIGGELFQKNDSDDLYHEWICVAETIRNVDHLGLVFIGTHLLGDVDFLLDFCDMLNKEIQICTSYDTSGRFFGKDREQWVNNIVKVQGAGYKVVCSATLTDAFIHDTDFQIPVDVDFKLQPIFVSEEWLENIYGRTNDPNVYSTELRSKMNCLPKREDVLKWFRDHKDIAKDYSTYSDKHASMLWDYDKVEHKYFAKEFVCSNYLADCGHPMIAHCYADSDKCTMCDAREMSSQ